MPAAAAALPVNAAVLTLGDPGDILMFDTSAFNARETFRGLVGVGADTDAAQHAHSSEFEKFASPLCEKAFSYKMSLRTSSVFPP